MKANHVRIGTLTNQNVETRGEYSNSTELFQDQSPLDDCVNTAQVLYAHGVWVKLRSILAAHRPKGDPERSVQSRHKKPMSGWYGCHLYYSPVLPCLAE